MTVASGGCPGNSLGLAQLIPAWDAAPAQRLGRGYAAAGPEGRRLTVLFVTVHRGDGRTYPEWRRHGDLAGDL